ncbi:MAG: type I methionyl aminopeptidase [Succinivibrio sp.]|nr:type I methionyl aminopeptidase [Succinivibrio sp.]
MDITLKSAAEIAQMREAGRIAAGVLEFIGPHMLPGAVTLELDEMMNDYIQKQGAVSADLGYHGYPRYTCISVNEVVCHGIPSTHRLRRGDIVNVDITVIKDGMHGDTSKMFIIGETSLRSRKLCECAQQCLYAGIREVYPGADLTQIGNAIQKIADKAGFSVVRDYCGHGIGRHFHEDPQVLHYRNQQSVILQEGMTFTIEPMINAGTWKCKISKKDGWTVTTADHQPSAQWEHTLAVTADGCEILTLRGEEKIPQHVVNLTKH